MKTWNIGVVGIGDISDVYIANLKKYDIVRVAACAARDLEKAKAKAKKYGIEKAYATADELIADPGIDIVLNLTTPLAHANVTVKALEAGKHVYSEKPLGISVAEGERIMAAARKRNLLVGCAPDTFLGGRLQTCRKLIDEGAIGKVTAAGAYVVTHGPESFHPNPGFLYEKGAGPLFDLGPYYLHALLSLLGPVDKVCAMSKRTFDEREIGSEPHRGDKIPVEVDTFVSGNLAFADGAIATLVASFDVWDSELPRIELYGTEGAICIPDVDALDGPNLFGGKVLLRRKSNYRWGPIPRTYPLADWEEVPSAHRFNETGHKENSRGIGLVDLVYALRDGRAPRAGGDMAFHAVEIMENMLASAKEERFVKMKSSFAKPAPLPKNFPDSEE